MDDFLKAYFGESEDIEPAKVIDINTDLAPKENIRFQDNFKIFKVDQNGSKKDY